MKGIFTKISDLYPVSLNGPLDTSLKIKNRCSTKIYRTQNTRISPENFRELVKSSVSRFRRKVWIYIYVKCLHIFKVLEKGTSSKNVRKVSKKLE